MNRYADGKHFIKRPLQDLCMTDYLARKKTLEKSSRTLNFLKGRILIYNNLKQFFF